MLVLGGIAWAVVVPAALLLRRPPAQPDDARLAAGGGAALSVAPALRTPQFAAIALTYFACCAAHSGPIFHMVSYALVCGVAAELGTRWRGNLYSPLPALAGPLPLGAALGPPLTRSSPCAARCAGARCASLLLSPAPRRSHPSSPTWASPPTPPQVAPARGPPLWEQAAEPVAHWQDSPAPVPEFVFDQRLGW